MMKKTVIAFICAVCLGNLGVRAQESALQRADENYKEYSFKPAIDIYEKLRSRGFVNVDLLERLGNSYYFNSDYEKAAEIYEELLKKSDSLDPDYYFRYAQSLKTIGNYQRSDSVMKVFRNTANEKGLSVVLESDYLEKIEVNSGRYDIKNFKFNSSYSDFAPIFYKQGLIFSSDRDTGNFSRYRHTWNGGDFLDLYKIVDLEGNYVRKLPGSVNGRFHESSSVVTKDGKTIYFTRNNFLDGKRYKDDKGTTRLKIYEAKLVDSVWTNIIELPFNSDRYSVAHPALSTDEKFLYFASDMPGTNGQSDLWKVEIIGDGTYGTPINLGSSINTKARETFPFVTENDILYFASDGHINLGGLDIFATKIAFDDYEQAVENVGSPVNSSYDDFSFIIDESTQEGYFASNRVGGMGSDDIYKFKENEPLRLDCIQDISGTVRDRISGEVLANAKVVVINEKNEEVLSVNTNSEGQYELDSDCNNGNFVRAMSEGYIPSEEYLPRSYGKPSIIDFYLERDVVTAGFGDDLAKLLQLSTIYFDLNKYDIRPDAEIEIQKVIAAMEKYPSLRIKVNSHTDSRGRDEYNLWLSQKRAESTAQYMVSKGIAKERLIGEGFGEKSLMNRCGNGVDCSDEEHQLNRRSEFIIQQ